MKADAALGKLLVSPSVSLGSTMLYGHGIYEAETRPKLAKPIGELLPPAQEGGHLLTVNDKKLHAPLRVRLRFADGGAADKMQS